MAVTFGCAVATWTKNYQEAEKEVQKRRNKQEPPKKHPGVERVKRRVWDLFGWYFGPCWSFLALRNHFTSFFERKMRGFTRAEPIG